MMLRVAAMATMLLMSTLSVSANGDQLAGFAPVDVSSWSPSASGNVMDLVAPLYAGHPETSEGRPELRVNLRTTQDWKIVIDIEMRGYLDDSVAGNNYRAIVIETADGWVLEALGQQNICYRGDNAGEPTTGLCP